MTETVPHGQWVRKKGRICDPFLLSSMVPARPFRLPAYRVRFNKRTATATTTVTAATTARFAGFGFVDTQSTTAIFLAVQGADGRLGFIV